MTASRPNLVRVGDIRPQPVRWLWPGRIPVGRLTLLSGDPGLGKSMISMDLAARLSSGTSWPGCDLEPPEAGGSIIMSAEDDLADTIRPRLDAAGADCDRVMALRSIVRHAEGATEERLPDLRHDLAAIEQAIEQTPHCRLVVIDPISAYLGSADSHRDAAVRGILAPLAELARQRNVAIVIVAHLRKSGGPGVYRTMGSLAFVAAVRMAWAIARDPDNDQRRPLLPQKANIAPDQRGLAYRIAGEGMRVRVEWDPSPVHARLDEVLAGRSGVPDANDGQEDRRPPTQLRTAAEWLRSLLADGPMAARRVQQMAASDGIAARTLRRARRELSIRPRRRGQEWIWRLPE